MNRTVSRYLYLVRHAEALPDESGLTERGRRQAVLLGRRLQDVPLSAVHHGPLPRAAQTARLVREQLTKDVPLDVSEAAGDYVPYAPEKHELPVESADYLLRFLQQASPEELERGPELARLAVERFTRPVDDEVHELVVTHNFLIGWLVRDAMDAPKWRWLSLSHCNAALTVIRYTPGRPSTVLLYNDMQHLPADLRWTGFPAEQHI
ncbi:histidine phosphatase family protein [Kribbella kalugense]|uniref:Putative phosphoglycerate mutase n=1 Tax=Kribbella kalugense TaxID=2512221 RepID=A0A4R7ZH53_9ACTN|nr:histidine phosphatase family protein [Kribbella kalugense]TDW15628.1 putative phosphoglycerate mutase [Kribbella kalugense]